MDFSNNQMVIIAIVAGVIIILALVSVISSRRRKKQDEEMNTFSTYKSTSGPKAVPENKPVKTSNYKFSLETGETIDQNDSCDISHTAKAITENDILTKMEEKLSKLNVSEERKERLMQQVRMELQKNNAEQKDTVTEKIEMIQNSKLSETQKKKVIEMLNKHNQNPNNEESVDHLFDGHEDK